MEQERLEKQLQNTQAQLRQYRSLYEHLPLLFLTLDFSSRIVAANIYTITQLDYSLAELLNQSIFQLIDREDFEIFQLYWNAVTQDKPEQKLEPAVLEEVRLIGKNQHRLWVKITAQRFQENETQALIFLFCENISQVKRLENQLQNVEISDHQSIENSLQKQTERERLMGVITQHIRQSLNLAEILNTTVAEVREFLQTDRVLIYRFEPDWSGFVIVESVGENWNSVLGSQIQDHCFREHYVEPYRQGRIQAIEDIYDSDLSPCHVQLLEHFQIRANLVVPILQGENLWGLLVANHCQSPHQWQQLEIDLLQELSAHLGIAIQQSELYEQVQKLNTNLESQIQERTAQLQQALEFEAMLKRITDKIRDSLDEGQILQTAVEELTVILGLEGCDTAFYNSPLTTAKICYEYAPNLPAAKDHIIEMADFPEGYAQLLQNQFFQFCEIEPSLRGPITILAYPIFDDQGILGDLWLFKQQHQAFNDLEIRLVEQVANQCAIAIRQARLFKAAQNQVEELEKLHQLKDDFLSTVSHELRTPICNIRVAIQMLDITLQKEESETAESPKKRYLQILKEESQREMGLINDLLDFQRLEAGTQPFIPAIIHLQDWIVQLSQPFQERISQQNQRLQITIPPQLSPLITDEFSLERILDELLNNACKYTPADHEIAVNVETQDEKIFIQVMNTGSEIPANEIPRIFEKFYRVPSADPWKQGGTGLGLALVKKLALHLGGKISVKSEKNQTCFTLELPWETDLKST
jgi:PAS domain S-box-containing protein